MRLIDLQPAPGGATATLQIHDNDWGSPEANQTNAQIEIYGYNFDPSGKTGIPYAGNTKGWQCAAQGGQHLGTFTCVGDGEIKATIDYAKAGFKAGESLYVSSLWCESGHLWGEWISGRPAGTMPLPEPLAARNAQLKRSRPWLRSLVNAGWRARAPSFAPRGAVCRARLVRFGRPR